MSERYATEPGSAWCELSRDEYDRVWAAFEERFTFRASTTLEGWPAIREPTPSVTFDLSAVPDGPRRGAAYDSVNAEALRAFLTALPEVQELVVLDWQHPAYRFRASVQALTWQAEWKVPVYPDGDYFGFFTEDFSEGTFGHPWERTLCVMGEQMLGTLGASLATWLPVKRRNGLPADGV